MFTYFYSETVCFEIHKVLSRNKAILALKDGGRESMSLAEETTLSV